MTRRVFGDKFTALKFGVVALVAMVVLATPATADFITRKAFIDKAVSVNNLGIITFEHEGSYRLWGVLPDVIFLRKLVVDNMLGCEIAGKTRGHRRSVEVVQCSFVKPSSDIVSLGATKEVAQLLIENQHGSELCFETLNWFGTCEID